MKEWKSSESVRKVHKELYNASDPDDPSSDTNISLIIQSTFPVKERTKGNAVWSQSVLEAIFDVEYLDSKIDVEIVDKWNKNLNSVKYILVIFGFELLSINVNIHYIQPPDDDKLEEAAHDDDNDDNEDNDDNRTEAKSDEYDEYINDLDALLEDYKIHDY